MAFLNVNIIREHGKFTRIVYRKPIFNPVYTYFDSF